MQIMFGTVFCQITLLTQFFAAEMLVDTGVEGLC
jgi:hypothetical protein